MTTQEPIRLKPYDSNWPLKFESEKKLIEQTLDEWVFGGIEHVGSTSVLGLTAKPTIDIMVGVKNLTEAKVCIPLLEKIGYVYAEYRPEIMHWFCKPSEAHREFHLYLMEYNTVEWKQRTGFRDYLRTHPETAEEYLDMKKRLAIKFENDREAYTQAKAEFIERISNLAI